ncbi:MAG: hypothetical protein Q3987_03240, partial [Oscillospiraceae bacterium]|nr:hypothetical protein [Oscillospiraceae bacterium]
MYLTKEPAGIDSVLFEENILKIKCTLRTVDRGVFSNQRKQVSVPGRMTVELFAPALNVVSVRIKNHNIIPRA